MQHKNYLYTGSVPPKTKMLNSAINFVMNFYHFQHLCLIAMKRHTILTQNHPSCWILWKLINHQPCKKLRAILLMVDHWFIVSIRQKREEWLILPREYLLQFKKVLKPLMFILSLINTENIASNQAHARQGYNHWECLIFLKVKSCKLYNNKDLIT